MEGEAETALTLEALAMPFKLTRLDDAPPPHRRLVEHVECPLDVTTWRWLQGSR
jgi:hypothetical protein